MTKEELIQANLEDVEIFRRPLTAWGNTSWLQDKRLARRRIQARNRLLASA